MNPTVITTEPADYGAGVSDHVTFSGCSYHVDDAGTLHIRQGNSGNIAAFASGEWRSVVNGGVVAREAKR